MSKYSDFFLIGSPEYFPLNGKLRLRHYGSWLAEEVWCREKQSKKRAQFTMEVVRLARKIAKVKGISEDDAFAMLQGGDEERGELFAEFSEEMDRLMALSPSSQEQTEELMTLFFKNRGEVLDGKKWTATEDWSKEDTQKLTAAMIAKVEQFMVKEDSVEDQAQAEEEEEGEEEGGPK
jgi:hypothetical protein